MVRQLLMLSMVSIFLFFGCNSDDNKVNETDYFIQAVLEDGTYWAQKCEVTTLTTKKTLSVYKDGNWTDITSDPEIIDNTPFEVVKANDAYIIRTSQNLLYKYQNERLEPLNSDITSTVKKSQNIAVDNSGNVWSLYNDSISIYNENWLSENTYVLELGHFTFGSNLTFDKDNNLLIYDRKNKDIQKMSKDFKLVGTISMSKYVNAVDNVRFVTSDSSGRIFMPFINTSKFYLYENGSMFEFNADDLYTATVEEYTRTVTAIYASPKSSEVYLTTSSNQVNGGRLTKTFTLKGDSWVEINNSSVNINAYYIPHSSDDLITGAVSPLGELYTYWRDNEAHNELYKYSSNSGWESCY